MQELGGVAMDDMIQAKEKFLGACQALVTLGKDDMQAQSLVADAVATCALFCSVEASLHSKPSQEASAHKRGSSLENKINVEEDVKEEVSIVWAQCVQECCKTAFERRTGVSVWTKLESSAPSLCAAWTSSLAQLGSCALSAIVIFCTQEPRLDRMLDNNWPTSKSGQKKGKLADFMDLKGKEGGHTWNMGLLLPCVWPKIGAKGGFLASGWSTRVAAVQLASCLALHDVHAVNSCKLYPRIEMEEVRGTFLSMYEELLQRVVFLALADTQWQVFTFAMKHAFTSGFRYPCLSIGLADLMLWK